MRQERLQRLFQEFVHLEASGGIVLMACTVAALAWANSPWSQAYFAAWDTELSISLGSRGIADTIGHWINDGMMALFFFVVGLEIKREFLAGELADRGRAVLPIAGALGGMIVPAALYALLNASGVGARGWSIPMATDIAFSVGVLALLGKCIPLGLRVFLVALAITDDIGAVLVIALVYTSSVAWVGLLVAAVLLAACFLLNRADVTRPFPYALLGVGVWLAVLRSGLHPAVAGILVAMTVPARRRLLRDDFASRTESLVEELRCIDTRDPDLIIDREAQAVLEMFECVCEDAETPLQRLLRKLHPWVAFGVLPLFALANAGVRLEGGVGEAFAHPVAIGVFAGLVIGKPLGISLFAWLAVKLRLASLPQGVTWRQIIGAGCLAGIGFTMSLFIAGLGLEEAGLLASAKAAVLTGSLVSGIAGWAVLKGASAPGTSSVACELDEDGM